ncbi:hypothetical protein FB451DRAFT_1177555 [Mycena latifolia]|nr:hypothetical protein FB451DRAFT_1177555 [Mycena latifolia]
MSLLDTLSIGTENRPPAFVFYRDMLMVVNQGSVITRLLFPAQIRESTEVPQTSREYLVDIWTAGGLSRGDQSGAAGGSAVGSRRRIRRAMGAHGSVQERVSGRRQWRAVGVGSGARERVGAAGGRRWIRRAMGAHGGAQERVEGRRRRRGLPIGYYHEVLEGLLQIALNRLSDPLLEVPTLSG